MATDEPTSDLPAALLLIPFMVCAPFAGYLRHHDYPLLSTEALTAFGILTLAGLVPGLICASLGLTKKRAFALFLFVPLIWFELTFDPTDKARFIAFIGSLLPTWGLVLAVFLALYLTLILFLQLYRHIASILCTVFGVFLIGALFLPVDALEFGVSVDEGRASDDGRSPATGPLPSRLHIVLDGHIGLAGLPNDIAGSEQVAAELERFYRKWGFRLYSRAYSQYMGTVDSLGNLFNGELRDTELQREELRPERGDQYALSRNRYFREATEDGLEIRVLQSDFLDYCSDGESAVSYCFTYPGVSIRGIRDTALSKENKAWLLLRTYLYRTIIARLLLQGEVPEDADGAGADSTSAVPESGNDEQAIRFFSLRVPSVFDRLADEALEHPDGTLIFAHLTLPHSPYVWASACELRPDPRTWLTKRPDPLVSEAAGDDSTRRRVYRAYYDQVRCTVALLDTLFTKLDGAGVLDPMTIVVHGDHGSRITPRLPFIENRERLTDRDYIDIFSTLFAIRSSQIGPGVVEEQRSLTDLFAEYLFADADVPRDDRIRLYLRQPDEDGVRFLEPVPMVQF